jgi:hypothetical protein
VAAETARRPCSSEALVCRSGLVADERRARVEGERLEAGVDGGTVLGRAAHHCRPDEVARLEGPGRGALAVEVAAGVNASNRSFSKVFSLVAADHSMMVPGFRSEQSDLGYRWISPPLLQVFVAKV